jgi:tetratricopeptide (TPR) repeat protein
MNELTLCLMVKDEERYLEACLESVHRFVDDMVIIDTGSSDSTIDIAKKYTDNVSSVAFNGDFSAIRNMAIDKATSSWILFIDADEEFELEEVKKIRNLIKNAPEEVAAYKFLRYNFFSTGGWYSGSVLKLFRNHPLIRYRKRVNESVQMSIEDLGLSIKEAPVTLNHFGHCRSVQERDAKSYKYMKLMEEQLEETKGDAVLQGYIGLIARTVGQFDKALSCTEKALELNPSSATVYSFRGHVLRSVGRNEEALEAYLTSTKLRHTDAAAWNMVGVMELTLQRYEDALKSFGKAYSLNPLLIHTLINMGLSHEALGNIRKALELYTSVAEKNKGFLHQTWSSLSECDPYRPFYYETIMQYPGLEKLLNNAKVKAAI